MLSIVASSDHYPVLLNLDMPTTVSVSSGSVLTSPNLKYDNSKIDFYLAPYVDVCMIMMWQCAGNVAMIQNQLLCTAATLYTTITVLLTLNLGSNASHTQKQDGQSGSDYKQ